MYIYLEKIDKEKNQYRFYSLTVTQTLFNNWALLKIWGRIGSKGKRRSNWFDTEQAALQELEIVRKKKEGRGYNRA